jgi:signal recognition particle subunit SEC65
MAISNKGGAMSNYHRHLEKLVKDYLSNYKDHLGSELDYFADSSDIEEAIYRAASLGDEDDRCFDHQRRIKKKAKDHIQKVLPNIMKELSSRHKKSTFQDLYELVRKTIAHPGIGELTVYDIAKRIGAKIKVMPDIVYLHCGALDGAHSLNRIMKGVLSEDIKKRRLPMKSLPEELKVLEPYQVENFLCNFKKKLEVLYS